MSTSLKVLKGGVKLGSSQVLIQGFSFIRNVIIARLISPADFGIAALFAMTFSLLEMMSNLAQERLLIQAEDGDETRLQDTVHFLQATRGMTNAFIIFVVAGFVARLFGVPQATWAFRCVALIPLLRGLSHTDVYRVQRHLRFGPAIAVDVTASIVVTLIAAPLALWFRNYAAMLWILVAQVVVSVIVTHIAAERPYRWKYDRLYLKRVMSFGWPLLINGVLLYLIFEGDRLTIGAGNRLFHVNTYSLTDLGVYSVAFAITMGPAMLIGNVSGALFLPVLSSVQNVREQFHKRYYICSQIVSLVASMIAVPFIISGGWVVTLIYGKKYEGAAAFIGWLACMWALRTVRQSPTIASMALGDTKNAMYSNIARAATFGAVLVVAATGHSLSWIAACGFFGELIALAVCVTRLQMVHSVPAMLFVRPFAIAAASMLIAAVTMSLGISSYGYLALLVATGILVLASIGGMLYFFPSLRRNVMSVVSRQESTMTA
jgi:O-antigen/teichoic acid export membrane protein